jgi:hypothetical protein
LAAGGSVFDGQFGDGGFELVEAGADPLVQLGSELAEGWTIAAEPVKLRAVASAGHTCPTMPNISAPVQCG